MASRTRAGVSLLIVLAFILPAATVAVAPPYLSGEGLLGFYGHGGSVTHATATCDPDGQSTIEWNVDGPATGPYPGTFTEHGVIVIGAQDQPPTGLIPSNVLPGYYQGTRGFASGPVVEASVEFQINSAEGQVTGTKTFSGATDAFGSCVVLDDDPMPAELFGGTGTGYIWSVRGTLAYEAEIVSGSGTYSDLGTSVVWFEDAHVVATGVAFESGNFVEEFVSANAPQGATTVSVTPENATNPVGTSHSVLATAKTAANAPAVGTTLLLSVSGSVTSSQTCVADVNGQCAFTYTGPALPGADLILVCADNNTNGVRDGDEPCGEATKAWLLPTSTPGQVTGGGHVLNPQDNEEVAFGFNAKNTSNGLIGNCSVVDIAPTRNIKIKCLTVTTLVVSGNTATIFGEGTINGVSTSYRIDVTDDGEPGAGHDSFAIVTGSGYSAGGLLDNGNVQVHT